MHAFERFSAHARRVLTHAQEEAAAARHGHIGTEHLLLGLLRDEAGVGGQALGELGVEPARAREAIEAAVPPGTEATEGPLVPTARVKKVIELAFEESRRLGRPYVGSEHLLLGLLAEGHGVAARVLNETGVTLDSARAEVGRLLEAGAREEASPSPSGRRARVPPGAPLLEAPENPAGRAAAAAETSAIGVQDLLDALAGSAAATTALARLVELRRAATRRREAAAAGDEEAAGRHRAEEDQLRRALALALDAWRQELGPSERAPES
jgi:ATP-dependent Clp protease ATP-binding subunit ClpA